MQHSVKNIDIKIAAKRISYKEFNWLAGNRLSSLCGRQESLFYNFAYFL